MGAGGGGGGGGGVHVCVCGREVGRANSPDFLTRLPGK